MHSLIEFVFQKQLPLCVGQVVRPEAAPLPRLRPCARAQERSDPTAAAAAAAAHVRLLLQVVLERLRPRHPRAHPHGREALQVRRVRARLHHQGQPQGL